MLIIAKGNNYLSVRSPFIGGSKGIPVSCTYPVYGTDRRAFQEMVISNQGAVACMD
jgi:hypothetical protein